VCLDKFTVDDGSVPHHEPFQGVSMQTLAVVIKQPMSIAIESVELSDPGANDLAVAVDWSGISTGTERLLWQGTMPDFPGMGYPLVPGYETVGRVVECGSGSGFKLDEPVFVPGSTGFKTARALFGGSARHLVLAESRAVRLSQSGGPESVLLALAATAHHVLAGGASRPDLIVGHGVLGRLLARLVALDGLAPPTVWERNPTRRSGAVGCRVLDPKDDARRDYSCICDVSGDASILDTVIQRLAPGGEIVLAGFYTTPLSFAFPPAFQREARMRVAAQFKPADLIAVRDLVDAGTLDLTGLISHRSAADHAVAAYETAFQDADCLKMVLDWRQVS
jgi:bacteriochlorophyllide a dehydrogenase